MDAEREEELMASEILRSQHKPVDIRETTMFCVDWLAYKCLVKSVVRLENKRKTLEQEIKTLTEAKWILWP